MNARRLPVSCLSAVLAACVGAGCARDRRLADAERRIDVLEIHVAALEALLDDGADGSDEGATPSELVAGVRRGPATRPAAAPRLTS